MRAPLESELQFQVLEQLPNPLLIKDADLRYVWVNPAFCEFFGRTFDEVVGGTDSVVFADRQASQCNGGDLRVLESGEVDHAPETVDGPQGEQREIITRKSRITLSDGRSLLVGVLHDVTEVSMLNAALQASEAELHEKAAELERLSNTDLLTDCLNRRGLLSAIEANKVPQPASVLAADIDHFKAINDQWGHDVGDDALRHVVDRVRSCMRAGDELARVGGEEFVLLLPGCPPDDAVEVAEQLRATVESTPMCVGDQAANITMSLGLVHGLTLPGDIDAALRQADDLLYAAKADGRNCVRAAAFEAPLGG